MNLDPRLLRFARAVALELGLAVFFGLGSGLLAIAQAWLLSTTIAGVFLGGKDLAVAWGNLVWLLVVIVARAVSAFLADWSATGMAGKIKTLLREKVYAHLLRMGPAGVSSKPAGELVATALQGVEALEAYFSQYIPQVALAGLIPLGVLLFVFPLDPLSGMILLITGPLIPFFMFLIGSNAEKLTGQQFRALRRMNAVLLDILQGLKTLKALGRSRAQVGRVAAVSERYRVTTMAVLRVTFISALALELLGTISTAIIAVQVGLRLLYGQMAFEQAFFLLVIAPDFYLPLRTLGLRFHASMQGITAARGIFSLLDQPELAPAEPRSPLPCPPVWERIEMAGVKFRYPDRDTQALDGLDLCLRRGQVTALVGESGSGKSTAAALLLRFLEPQTGSLRVDDFDLCQIAPGDWRTQTAWVPQRPHLFNTTLAENLRLARSEASSEELWAALEQARLADFAHGLPQGVDTPLGENGARLSSGQAQRLALARAFLRSAPLLVLDEPTAHLDPQEEALVEKAVVSLCAGRTVLVIAHRLETIARADQIVVLQSGRAVEKGRHSDLLAAGGSYARLLAAYEDAS